MVLSSTASIVHITFEPKVFSEKDWNGQAIKMIREQGKSAPVVANIEPARLWQSKVRLSLHMTLPFM
jgi:hypothetical protein